MGAFSADFERIRQHDDPAHKVSRMEWTVLNAYESEVEGRVVESFLTAQGFEVQLLDTFGKRMTPTRGGLSGGLRLMVRSKDLEAIRVVLQESQKGSHLSIVGEEQPLAKSPAEKWMLALLIALMTLVYMLTKI